MKIDKTKLLVVSLVLLPVFIGSYIYFLKYQPKALKKIEEIKGVSTIATDEFPYPVDAKKIGFTQTPNSSQTIFQTSKTPLDVLKFYKNIFEAKNWIPSGEGVLDHTTSITYQNKGEKVTIVATSEENSLTVVSINEIEGKD